MDIFQEKIAELKCLIDADNRISISIVVDDQSENEHLDCTHIQKKMMHDKMLKQ